MKVLSVWGPYAQLIGAGIKDVENRSWGTKYRGAVAIHCTAGSWSAGGAVETLWRACRGDGLLTAAQVEELAGRLEGDRGKIIAVVNIVGSCSSDGHRSPWAMPGGQVFELSSARWVEPVAFTGKRGLVDLPPNIAAKLRATEPAPAEGFEARVAQLLAKKVGYIVTDRENITYHPELKSAAVEYHGTRTRGFAPALTSCRTGEGLLWDQVRAYSPHTVIDAAGNVIADSEQGERAPRETKIWHAIRRARATEPSLGDAQGAEARRAAVGRVRGWMLINVWTGERLTYDEALQVARRGHRG